MLQLYNTVLWPLRVFVAPWAAWKSRDPERAREWRERRALALPRAGPGGVWLHGASVGEARVVASVCRRLRERRPDLALSVSAGTRTGRGGLPAPPQVDAAFFVPLDFPGLPTRLFEALQPAALVLVETELWPNLIREAVSARARVAVINARLSPRRMGRYRRLRALYRPLLERLTVVGAQSIDDAQRFIEIGVPPSRVRVTGNVKYDLEPPEPDRDALRARLGLDPGRPVLVAGSTAAGEDPVVLEAFTALAGREPKPFLVLAPRHPERADDVEREARERGVRLARLGAADASGSRGHDGVLVDTVGQLASLYALARVAFVGGSLVPVGGHNVLEPASLGVPVLVGPHTDHVREPVEALLAAGAARRVTDAATLARAWSELLSDDDAVARMGAAARTVLERNRGALERTVGLIDKLVGVRA